MSEQQVNREGGGDHIRAYHESGHVIAAYHYGICIVELNIEDAPDRHAADGVNFGDWPEKYKSNIAPKDYAAAYDYWWARIVIHLAGREAEEAPVRPVSSP